MFKSNHKGALNEELWSVWEKLREPWTPYLQLAGLNLEGASRETLSKFLLYPIKVNFELNGLEELSRECTRGIEPADPSRSLFYHVFASPNVTPHGISDADYPTFHELEVIENCIFAASFPSLEDLQRRAGSAQLAIVVFAYEYAPAIDTVHRRHADMCFSRTAVSRVGNAVEHYIPKARGFLPNSDQTGGVHVVPARFGAFIATQRKGNKQTIGPERFQKGDENREFWVPLHKLFNGSECVDGFDIDLSLTAHHVNEKLRRVHLALHGEGSPTPWPLDALDKPPFRITEDLGKFDATTGLMTPVPHPLTEPAKQGDEYVGFQVPPHHKRYNATLWFQDDLGARRSPEFVHAKHAIVNGEIVYLPEDREAPIDDIVDRGGYIALNFVDYTADGWVDADCPTLAVHISRRVSAYSIIAQPDFFPLVKQQDLMEWWEKSVPSDIKGKLWPSFDILPSPLSESRYPANFTLLNAHFDSGDSTITTIIGMDRVPSSPAHISPARARREATLSYRATNLFGPGWDVSADFNRDRQTPNGTLHLANYGLGSPYLEDTLICAANGAFWPGAAPDITRFFASHAYPSVTPFYDGEAGWDKLPLPARLKDDTIEYRLLSYADYVKIVCDSNMRYEEFANTSLEDYITRTFVIAKVYQALGATSRDERARYSLISFRPADASEVQLLKKYNSNANSRQTYFIRAAHVTSPSQQAPGRPGFVKVRPDKFVDLIADPTVVIPLPR